MTLGDLASLNIASWQMLLHSLTSPAGLMVLAAFVLAGAILAAVARRAWVASEVTGSSLLARLTAQRGDNMAAALRRQFDPDAAGRARPRAPAIASPAA